jgi:hypothetical protein
LRFAGKPSGSRGGADGNSNEDWEALSSAISNFCEADLMALDEDLQEVAWGDVASSTGHHQILSPLAALGTRTASGA